MTSTNNETLTRQQVLAHLVEWASELLARPASQVDVAMPIHELGLSSLDAVDLLTSTERLLAQGEISTVLLEDYPSLETLASRLRPE